MSLSTADNSFGEPPYPTYDNDEQSRLRRDATSEPTLCRLDWTLNGPLEHAVLVRVPKTEAAGACVPLHDAATGAWHPIADYSICRQRIRSIEVHVNMFEDWEESWLTIHEEHSDPDDIEPCCNAAWGVLPEYGPEPMLLRCCDTERPTDKDVSIVVRPAAAASTDDNDSSAFVTVRDYVTTVHPWLMGLRGSIDELMTTMPDLYTDWWLPKGSPLVVNAILPHKVGVEQKGAGKLPESFFSV